MSEPVTNVEIEDVLSSIRRLVSEDVTPKPSEPDNSPEAEQANVKLVLTPDFRVVDDAPKAETEPESITEPQQTSVDEEATDMRGQTLENRIADLEATLGDQPSNWEPDGSSFSEDVDAEQMIGEKAHSWHDDAAQETVDTQKNNAAAEQEFEAAMTNHTTTSDLEFEPSPDIQFTAFNGDDAEIVDAEVVPDVDRAEVFPEDDSEDFYTNDAVIDEDTLRDMVSEIVREELQGAMGERITRNVRKLVRREINRVLANQDFE